MTRRLVLPLRNAAHRVIQPWGVRQMLAPGGEVFGVAREPDGGDLEVERGEGEIVVYGRTEQVAISPSDPREPSLAD